MSQSTAAPLPAPLTGWTVRAIPDAAGHLPPQAPRGPLDARVPGTVHLELLRRGLIPDPHATRRDAEVAWVGETTWAYEGTFEVTDRELAAPHLDLCLGGLDTLCRAELNGHVILESENMFVPQRVDVRGHVQPGVNRLTLRFDPVLARGRALEAQRGRRAVWNGDPSRVYVRKAPYHYGWDWGPTLLTAGPWGDVTVHAYAARLDDVHTAITVTDDLQATLNVSAAVVGRAAPGDTVEVEVQGPDGAPAGHLSLPADAARGQLSLPAAALWWPRGYGPQARYAVSVTLRRAGAALDRVERRLGARHLRLEQAPVAGEPGVSFTFVVNGVPVFAGGANWIPADLLLNRVTPALVRDRLTQAADANMVMVRVWGGGIYETDDFYDTCDELGLLVWQDFVFACGLYPAHPEFLRSVRAEAEAAVRRLRHHPSLALWCGNNEDYPLAESVGACGPDADPARFEARVIYEQLLPEVVGTLHPGGAYWPGSPSGGASSDDPTVGDRHAWEVWHGPMAPHREYGRYAGRFVSEFGLQSTPSLHVIGTVTPPEERRAHSALMEGRNRAADPQGRPDGTRRLAAYLSDTFDPARDFEEYVYQTRFVQASAMVSAYRAFRGRWGQDGARAVSGALVWQLNDVWPATSWAVIDSAGLPKPAYHAIRRELAPLAVQARRDGDAACAWVVSAARHDQDVTLHLDVYALDGRPRAHERRTVRVRANAVTPLDLPALPALGGATLFLRLVLGGAEVSRAALWPEPLKHHPLPDPGLSAVLDGRALSVQCVRPAHGVWIDAGAARPSDNHLDLRPGERCAVTLDREVPAASVTLRAVGSGPVPAQSTRAQSTRAESPPGQSPPGHPGG